jgi:putative ABC transport system permease protein
MPHSPKKQVVLPFTKSVEISVKSIRSRFLRSLITTVSLILAIAFFSYIKTNANIAQGILISQDKEAVQQLVLQGYELTEDSQVPLENPKERWILFLSLLVCVVGIVNTQLMAVADRFREIGTMKCLGALDRFVLKLFLIEAALQGIIGASTGALTGIVISLAAGFFKFGGHALSFVNFQQLAVSFVTAVSLGCFLSILGVLYPALLAAKMQPVEAMRGRD